MKKPLQGNPSIAVAYLRASTDDQQISPEAQRFAIESWASREGVTVVSWHVEHITSVAPLDARQGLLAALEAIRTHHAGVLIVAKRNRLAREPAIMGFVEYTAKQAGARVLSADGASSGTGIDGIIRRGFEDIQGQIERLNIRDNTKRALDYKRTRGESVGTLPYGYQRKLDGRHTKSRLACPTGCLGCLTLEPNETEQATIALARTLRARGLTLRAIAGDLTRVGRLSRKSRPFHSEQIARMLGDGANVAPDYGALFR